MASRDSLKRQLRTSATSIIVVIVAVIATLLIADRANHASTRSNKALVKAEKAITLLEGQAFGECERVQVLREDTNMVAVAQWQAFSDVLAMQRLSVQSHQPPRLHRLVERFYRDLKGAVASVTYQPPTNCAQAIHEPLRYEPPRPESVARHLREPK